MVGIINDHTAAGGGGSVIYFVSVKDTTAFRSDILREGMAPLPVTVNLKGELALTLDI